MRPLDSLGLRTDGRRVWILDQTQLPDREVWLDGSDPDTMVGHLQQLRVRGAPLIGVAAAVSIAWLAEQGAGPDAVRGAAGRLRAARPTAVNLMLAVDRMLSVLAPPGVTPPVVGPGTVSGRGSAPAGGTGGNVVPDPAQALAAEAEDIFDEDVALCESMAAAGAPLIRDGDGVLTHCNTGGLATVGIGTALGVVRRAFESGIRLHVYVDETRPLLQGARLTTWELSRLGIPYTLLTDSMAAILMREGRVQRVMVGADRIARNGDVANKVGTYALAIAAHHHSVPFYVVAPWTTVDLDCPDGGHIPIEQRASEEVRGARGGFGSVRWSPESAPTFNPAFDVTPASLVTALVLDRGVVSREALAAGASLRDARE